MIQTKNSTSRRKVLPLSADEAERGEQIGRRLREEVRALVEQLPPHLRQSYALSRELNVDRSICQKVLTALKVSGSSPGLAVLDRMPGTEGLSTFVDAFRAVVRDARFLEAARVPVEQLQRFLRDTSGSHARLRARINSTVVADAGTSETTEISDIRERLFADMAETMRCQTDLLSIVTMTRPLPDDAHQIEHASAKALIGYRSRAGARPLVESLVHSGERCESEHQTLSFVPLPNSHTDGPPPQILIEELSSQPLPIVTSRGPRNMAIEAIDPSVSSKPIDLVVARRTTPVSHPVLHQDKALSICARIKTPTRRLVFDSYVHRSIAIATLPDVGTYSWDPSILTSPRKSWYERLPGSPRLELLGPGIERAATPAWDRQEELTKLMFDRLGWPAEDFVGYRTEVAYPLWGSACMMIFDFEA